MTGASRHTAALALVLAIAGAAIGLSTPAQAEESALAAYYGQQVDWQACGDDRCASIAVPLDYANPAGAAIKLAVRMAPHRGAASLGALLMNPGGPGAPGLDFADYLAEISPQIANAYDVVSFDPRGVGDSAPITCMTGAQTTRWLLADPTPDTAAEVREYTRLAASIGVGCQRMSPSLATHIGTDDTVRDLDVLREVLHDSHLNLVGFSYGTALATRYAELFPDRVGRFVLDGALDPQLDSMQLSRGQSDGFQTAFTRFAKDCTKHRDCVGTTAASVTSYANRLLRTLDSRTMPGGSLGPLNEAQALAGIAHALYSTSNWPMLRNALAQTKKGSGAGLQWLSSEAWARTGKNSYANNGNSAFYAISCWDFPATPGAPGLAAAARAWSKDARVPALASSSAWTNAPCSTWFGHSTTPPHRASSTTTSPMLIIGTRFDPATPYRWAVSLAEQLPTSRLLTYDGDGHTAFGGPSACIDAKVVSYLIDGTLPAAGTRCR